MNGSTSGPGPQFPQVGWSSTTTGTPITVNACPNVEFQDGRPVFGDSTSTSLRSYTALKILGDGSFATVFLCDWHSPLAPNTLLPAMQIGAGARPEWAGKRLVAIKRLKRKWELDWDACQRLQEFQALRTIPPHANITPFYDAFIVPSGQVLYFVTEPMEGNLYHLCKSRNGRPFAQGLNASIAHQVILGLQHIHASGFLHRDIIPENILVTTTGLYGYPRVSATPLDHSEVENDVVVIIKLGDFGSARPLSSPHPYTEYMTTRWYRAPEILLLGREYSSPVDLWAFGAVLAEAINLRPIFPGSDQIDQITKLIEILGNPGRDPGDDENEGGGLWPEGVRMARAVGFAFPDAPPRDFRTLFDARMPSTLIDLISGLLKWDPARRLTIDNCAQHPYFTDMLHVIRDIPTAAGSLT